MNLLDYLLLALIFSYSAFVVYKLVKKKNDCTHVCSSCSSSNCHLQEYTQELKRIKEEGKS